MAKKITGLAEKTTLVDGDYDVIADIEDSNKAKKVKQSTKSSKFQDDFMASDYKSTDGTLASNSDDVVPTEKAVKTYTDNNTSAEVIKTKYESNANTNAYDDTEKGKVAEGVSHRGDSTIHFTQSGINIPASQINDFDAEVGNNVVVSANTTHKTSDGTDHTYINQDVRTTANPTFSKVSSQNEATENKHLVRLDQMNSAIAGISWQAAIKSKIDFTTSEPVSPADGDRYINTVTGNSSNTGKSVTANYIYEWDGDWIETAISEGAAVWDIALDTNYTFNGTSWVEFGSTLSHNNTSGLQGGQTSQYYHLNEQDYAGRWESDGTNTYKNTGKVGIGTAAPEASLDVNGDIILKNGTSVNEISIDGTLADNSDDSVPTEKAVKTYVDTKVPYKVYRALLSQRGTNAPTATVLENTTGITPIYSFIGGDPTEGIFTISFPNYIVSPANVYFNIQNNMTNTDIYTLSLVRDGDGYNIFDLRTYRDGSYAVGRLLNTPFEILVYGRDFVLKASAGRFNFSFDNPTGRLWTFPEGTVLYSDGVTPIETSTDEQPDVIIPDGGGNVILESDSFSGNYILNDNNTDSVYVGDLSDLPALTYFLRLRYCTNITGDLSDLPALTYFLDLRNCSNITGDLSDLPALTYFLDLYNCSNITGDLSDLPALTYFLDLYNCTNITGDLSDLPALSYWLDLTNCSNITGDLSDLPALSYYLRLQNCSNISGVYNAVSGTNVPTITYLSYTGLSETDMDETLIAYAATTKNDGTFTAVGMTRTVASDAAVATLTGAPRNWTITGITKV